MFLPSCQHELVVQDSSSSSKMLDSRNVNYHVCIYVNVDRQHEPVVQAQVFDFPKPRYFPHIRSD